MSNPVRPIPDRIEHLGSDLDGILRATGDGQPPKAAVPGEHYVTPEDLNDGLDGKADLAEAARLASLQYALSPIGHPIAWDSFRRPDSQGPIGSGSLGTAGSGHTWLGIDEPSGTWNAANRNRYFKIQRNSAVIHNPINAGYAASVISDPALAITPGSREFLTGRLVGLSMVPIALILRWIDADNWLACEFGHSAGRFARIRQCIDGGVSILADENLGGLANHYAPFTLQASLGLSDPPGSLQAELSVEAKGDRAGLRVVIAEQDDPNWFAALLANTRAGIMGSAVGGTFPLTGFAVGKLWGES